MLVYLIQTLKEIANTKDIKSGTETSSQNEHLFFNKKNLADVRTFLLKFY